MDIPSLISDAQNYVSNVVNQFIVRPTDQTITSGIGGFVFNILDDEEILLTSEVTDHYVEDNYAIQDHISNRPEQFTLRGYVAELADIFPQAFLTRLAEVQSLAGIAGFANTFSVQATQVYAELAGFAAQLGNVLNHTQNIYDMFKNNNTSANKQQEAFNFFYSLWLSRELVTVETPFAILNNLAIVSVRVTQRGDTRLISDFAVTFKKIRIATTKTVTATQRQSLSQEFDSQQGNLINSLTPQGSGRAEQFMSGLTDRGITSGSSVLPDGSAVDVGLLTTAFGG